MRRATPLLGLLLLACEQSPPPPPASAPPPAARTSEAGAANGPDEERAAEERVEPENLEPGDKTVLVELYTSQGCNSCPAADAFIGEFPQLGWTPDKVIPLTFHVTYWDDLGWKDPYGSMTHDQRQIGYAQTVPSAKADDENTIKGPFTPQLVVDGRVHFSGTLQDVAKREVTRASQQPTPIELSARSTVSTADDGKLVSVDVKSVAAENSTLDTDRQKVGLFAALTQKTVQTEVPRGENAGKKLDEFWVVREFQGPKLFRSSRDNETHFDLALPPDTGADQLDVVVFAQDLASLQIYATTTVPALGSPAGTAAGME